MREAQASWDVVLAAGAQRSRTVRTAGGQTAEHPGGSALRSGGGGLKGPEESFEGREQV